MPLAPRTDGALEALYREVDAELRALRASCEACGRCCRFAEYGHELWVTNLEISFLRARHGSRSDGAAGVCPYLEGDACSARAGRALACRTFHCSLSKEAVEEITSRYFERLRALARAEGLQLEYSGLSAGDVRAPA